MPLPEALRRVNPASVRKRSFERPQLVRLKTGETITLEHVPYVARPDFSAIRNMNSRELIRRMGWRQHDASFERGRYGLPFTRNAQNPVKGLGASVRRLKHSTMTKEEISQRNSLADAFRLLRRTFHGEDRSPLSGFRDSFRENRMHEFWPQYDFMVARNEERKIVGVATTHTSRKPGKPKVAVGEYIAVNPAYLGKGLGTEMMNARIRKAVQNGAEHFLIEGEPLTRKDIGRMESLKKRKTRNEEQESELLEILNRLRASAIRAKLGFQIVEGVRGISPALEYSGAGEPNASIYKKKADLVRSSSPVDLFYLNLSRKAPSSARDWKRILSTHLYENYGVGAGAPWMNKALVDYMVSRRRVFLSHPTGRFRKPSK
ncbi:GNAT family N-acetyltransferase [Candidatus Micrarchaeota archaeon]|nr:GNAT family N-acetyltransferase [Candidatus Micrarchaeota archaeon]